METDPLTPEERRIFDSLVETVLEELRAQISVHRLDTVVMDLVRAEGESFEYREGDRDAAALIADVIWENFELMPRPERRA